MTWLEDEKGWKPNLDAAASIRNTKAPHFYSKVDNALEKDWFGHVWVNPPYGRELSKWVEKAALEIKKPLVKSIMMLLPARTDVKWFHDTVIPNAWLVYFIKGRLYHRLPEGVTGYSGSAPFGSMIVHYRKHNLPCAGMRVMEIPKEARGY